MARLRPESSVSPDFDDYGELCFPGVNHGAVVTRTPEELGIPRVLSGARREPSWWPKADLRPELPRDLGPGSLGRRPESARRGNARGARMIALRAAVAARLAREREPELRMIEGEPVRLPARAVMGAELIGQKTEKEKEGEMPTNNFNLEDETNAKIAAEPLEAKPAELAKKYKVPVSRVYGIRCRLRRLGKLPARVVVKKNDALARRTNGVRPVEVDAKRPGGAAALINALERADAQRAVMITLELSGSDVSALMGNLSDKQRTAFLSAGLRAALLA